MSEFAEIKFYFAYTSPFTYLAWKPAQELERSHRVRMRFIPYGVNVRKVYGDVDRTGADKRKVRYLYVDARRIAKERGLVIIPPKKIYSARLAFYGGMFADRYGKFRDYAARVFERFWKGELEVDEQGAIERILAEIGVDVPDFGRYIGRDARAELDACFAAADADGVFGVPTFVIDRELFWGEDRIDWVVRKLDALGLRR
ncbi:MAG: DsbA family protein [Candidatus Binataceae bacterium]